MGESVSGLFSKERRSDRSGRIILLLLAAIFAVALFMRVYRLDSVPLGVHYDEILNGEIALDALRGGPQYFYDRAGGREGLYHLFLTASFALPMPVAWQLRLPSVFLSLLGLLLTYLWVARAFGRWAAVTATGLMAVSFWTVWMGRAALRVNTVTPVAAGAALLMVYLIGDGNRNPISPRNRISMVKQLGLGLVIALCFYTYRAGYMVFALFFVFTAYLLVWHRDHARKLILPLLVASVLALPIFILFLTQPEADPRFGVIAVPWQAMLGGDFGPVLQSIVDNIGMFFWQGDLEAHYNLPGRPIFEPVSGALFVVGLGLALWRWKQPVYAFCLLWLVVGLLPGIFTLPTPSFVHTVSAQGVTYVFPGLTIAALSAYLKDRRPQAQLFVAGFLMVLITGNAIWTGIDYFQKWPAEPEVRGFHQSDLAQIAKDLEEEEGMPPVAICSSVLNEEDSFWRSGRQSLPFLLNRDDVTVRWYDCGDAQVIPSGDDTALFYFPDGTGFGEWIGEHDRFVVERTSLHEDVVRVRLDVDRWKQRLLAELSQPAQLENPVQFGDEMAFLGFMMDAEPAVQGMEMTLITFWEVTGSLPAQTSVFVHLMADDASLLAQGDGFSTLSDTLAPGDVVAQLHRLQIPSDAAPGEYPLSVGVYSRTGEWPPLSVVVDGETREARLVLEQISVSAKP